jgi:2-oxoisovalerate dehydrogenase E2 component (dihydrolipoyl transacylase)
MGIFRLKLPDLGEGVVDSEIVAWRVAPGDKVIEDQPIVDVMTDKATVEVGSPVNGVVISIACKEGDILRVGQEMIRFEVAGAGNFTESTEEKSKETQSTQIKSSESANHAIEATSQKDTLKNVESTISPITEKLSHATLVANTAINSEEIIPAFPHRTILTSPSVRRLAREQGIDLSSVPGSGPEGRIEHRDIETFIAVRKQQLYGAPLHRRSGVTTTKISGIRRVIAKKISATKRNIPHYSYIEEVDLTDLEKLRQQLNAERKLHQPKLTLLPFVMHTLAKVLPEFPHCNATYNDETEELTEHAPVHIGIATMTDQGLAVPVVRHCEALDLWQAANEIARLSDAVRKQNATREELTGSTITITSLGPLGGIATTPVINAPETAIIGINKLQQRPIAINGEIVVRTMMNISASFDHRIVDGYDGARLVQALKKLLETPAMIFL